MQNIAKLYVVEYSASQGCFHIHQVEDMLETNLRTFVRSTQPGYIPIAIVETHEQAGEIIETILKKLPETHPAKSKSESML